MNRACWSVLLVLCLAVGCETVRSSREHVVEGTVMTEASGRLLADGSRNRASRESFAALPSRSALGRRVEVTVNGRSVVVPVRDVGPWHTNDPYWDSVMWPRPRAESRLRGERNSAGIDLSLACARSLGLSYPWKGEVRWRFCAVRQNDGQ